MLRGKTTRLYFFLPSFLPTNTTADHIPLLSSFWPLSPTTTPLLLLDLAQTAFFVFFFSAKRNTPHLFFFSAHLHGNVVSQKGKQPIKVWGKGVASVQAEHANIAVCEDMSGGEVAEEQVLAEE